MVELFELESDMGGSFPYKSNYLKIGKNKLAYIDEGPKEAPVLLMCHGNPTWSYLYRHFIAEYSKSYRCVVPDHLGFGRSSKPKKLEDYTLIGHIDNLTKLVNHLDLKNVFVVGQDWGGPIGLGWAARNKERVGGLVILNTWTFVKRFTMKLPLIFRFLLRTKNLGNWITIRRNVFVNRLIPFSIYVKANIKPDKETMMKAYRAPFPKISDRKGIHAFPRMIPTKPSHPDYNTMLETEENLVDWGIPALLFIATKDRAFGKKVAYTFHEILPNSSEPIEILAGHFCQEDGTDEIFPHLKEFLIKHN
ncbi:MAG: Haloalkane dehalogenase [Candidatus Heimdallarchaeota archaeon LC_2]|nr:MAG: Haloalkane dehalogenase [Candidatus Heimdallarchaeota archaeon LC_2]